MKNSVLFAAVYPLLPIVLRGMLEASSLFKLKISRVHGVTSKLADAAPQRLLSAKQLTTDAEAEVSTADSVRGSEGACSVPGGRESSCLTFEHRDNSGQTLVRREAEAGTVGQPCSVADLEEAVRTGQPVLEQRQGLPDVYYLHNLFSSSFLQELEELRGELPSSSCSNNMYADRHFFRSAAVADRLLAALPPRLRKVHVLSDLRFICYPPGGYIAPHVDGIRTDDVTQEPSTTSFLLYLQDVPEGEGGETEFVESVEYPENVLWSVRPRGGSILIFPHSSPHQGAGVGLHPKVLLRGDMY